MLYVPLIGREAARRRALSLLLNGFFDGSPELLVLNLLGRDEPDEDDLKRVRELIGQPGSSPAGAGRVEPMTILVTWLWQGIVLAAVTTASLRWATRLNAATRHVIYWVALTAVLLLPAVSWLTTLAPPAPAILGFAAGAAAALDPCVAPVQIPLPDWILAIVVGAWMGMLVVGLMRLSVALGALQRLQATSRPLAEQRQRQLPMWSLARGFGRRAELRVSADLRGACAIGLGQPVIVVADTLVDALTDGHWMQVRHA